MSEHPLQGFVPEAQSAHPVEVFAAACEADGDFENIDPACREGDAPGDAGGQYGAVEYVERV